MTKYVLDASAVLALIFLERGWEKVESIRNRSALSTVNLSEILAKLAQDEINITKALNEIIDLNINIVEFNQSLATKTAELRSSTKRLGLSLGDRACLALAISEGATAVTADKAWSKIEFCPIEVIR